MSCSTVQERYVPQAMAANTSYVVSRQAIGGFIAVTTGTITVRAYNNTILVNNFPVTAGLYSPLPIYLGQNGGTVTLSGGASGTLVI